VSPKGRQIERRHKGSLREVLDDLLEHARAIARRVKDMTPEELDYAQQRLEWLADEVWRAAILEEKEIEEERGARKSRRT
jgi:DNA polymerase elongation subunit (family B)